MKKAITLILLASMFLACNNSKKEEVINRQKILNEKASGINNDFKKIRNEVGTLADKIANLYRNQDNILPTIDPEKYEMAENGVLLKPINDGGSALFVSGYIPINEEIKKIAYFTEPIDSVFISMVNEYPEIVQLYYNDKYSLNRIYPYFDVLLQYEPKMDIPSFNFYYLADAKHNPEKKSLWLSEPYVDPAGRGWMVSAIAPVYFEDDLAGVAGIDVTINMIAQRYLLDDPSSLTLIIDNTGVIVTAQERAITLLSFPPLFDHKYIETIKQDTYRKEQYNISISKEANVRAFSVEILKNNKNQVPVEINHENMTVISAHIPELNWYLLEIIK